MTYRSIFLDVSKEPSNADVTRHWAIDWPDWSKDGPDEHELRINTEYNRTRPYRHGGKRA